MTVSGWYHLLDESLAMSKHLRTDSPDDPLPVRSRVPLEERLYENTTEHHYKQPKKIHASVYSGKYVGFVYSCYIDGTTPL